jgi:hypothetical protein
MGSFSALSAYIFRAFRDWMLLVVKAASKAFQMPI